MDQEQGRGPLVERGDAWARCHRSGSQVDGKPAPGSVSTKFRELGLKPPELKSQC